MLNRYRLLDMDFGIDQSGVQQLIGATDQELAHSIFTLMTKGQVRVLVNTSKHNNKCNYTVDSSVHA